MSLLPSHSRIGGGVLKEVDLRRARRYSDKGSMIQASWIDAEGNVNVGMVRVINISEHGLALELPVVPQQAAMVRIQSDRHKLTGTAMVRHVSEQGSRCVVGLEFANGMKWIPPWEENPESSERDVLGEGKEQRIKSTLTTTIGLQPTAVPVRPRLAEIKPPGANVVVMKPANAAEPKAADPAPVKTKPAGAVNAQSGPSALILVGKEADGKEADAKSQELKADAKPVETADAKAEVKTPDAGTGVSVESKAEVNTTDAKAGVIAEAKAGVKTPEANVEAKAVTKAGPIAEAKALDTKTPDAKAAIAPNAKAPEAKAKGVTDAGQPESKPSNGSALASKGAIQKPTEANPQESVPAASQPTGHQADLVKRSDASLPSPEAEGSRLAGPVAPAQAPESLKAEPTAAEPAVSKPAVSKPAVSKSAVSEPAVAEPAKAEPSKPPEPAAENLDDFWGWSKQ